MIPLGDDSDFTTEVPKSTKFKKYKMNKSFVAFVRFVVAAYSSLRSGNLG